MTTQHTPTRECESHSATDKPTPRWIVSHWSGGEGCRAGFYVSREIGTHTEWLVGSNGRAKRFAKQETAARAALAMGGKQ